MHSENPSGADNQQGSLGTAPMRYPMTPQRLHAELLAVGANGLFAYLQGSLRDGTRSTLHKTHRFCQSNRQWLLLLKAAFSLLGHRSWLYREGRERQIWILETTAPFLDIGFDAKPLLGSPEALLFVRGYFDADGGMPKNHEARLYFQLCQKNFESLATAVELLESWDILCGRIHNPSVKVDPDYWRVFVRKQSHQSFIRMVSSWHPEKRQRMDNRMKI